MIVLTLDFYSENIELGQRGGDTNVFIQCYEAT